MTVGMGGAGEGMGNVKGHQDGRQLVDTMLLLLAMLLAAAAAAVVTVTGVAAADSTAVLAVFFCCFGFSERRNGYGSRCLFGRTRR